MNGFYRLSGPAFLDCTVLVIGSGAGGAAVAAECCAAGLDVLMVEEGPFVPEGGKPASLAEAFAQSWRGGGLTVALGRPPVAYAEGRCVGGGTEINSAIIQRTPPELLDQWAQQFAIADFGADILDPIYRRVEAALGVDHPARPPGPVSDVLKRGAESKGWAVSTVKRAQQGCVGANQCVQGCPTGAKQTMMRTFLADALAKGLRLVAGLRVVRLVIKSGRVVAAQALATDLFGRTHPVRIRCQDVFVCAGAVHTPALLRRSGLRAGIGDTLRLHPMIKAVAEFDYPLSAAKDQLPTHAVTQWMPDRRIGGSIFTPGLMAAGLSDNFAQAGSMMDRVENCGLYYAQVRGRGAGRVRPLSTLTVEPLVRYELTPEDRQGLTQGLADLVELLLAAGAKRVQPCVGGMKPITSSDQVRNLWNDGIGLDRATLSTIHLTGSCPPGQAPGTATDSFGRVHGLANVVLADASQIPDAPGTNPQATVIALALRAAQSYLSLSSRSRAATTFAQDR